MTKKIWIDIVNSSQAQFFRPFVEELYESYDIVITTRDFAETNELVSKYGVDYKCVSRYVDTWKTFKILYFASRALRIFFHVKNFDFVFTHGSASPIFLKRICNGKWISSYDNEYADSFKIFCKHSDFFIVPKILEKRANSIRKSSTKIFTYPGIKEQIYLADFKPSKNAISSIPFENYIVVRPEAWKSDYVNIDKILAYRLTKELAERNYNIVYLSRYRDYPRWINNYDNIYVPQKAIDGKQLVWFSNGVLTGSGTLAREAGVLGVPSVSFYPGKPLKVDLWMEEKGFIYRSRDLKKILNYLKISENKSDLLSEAMDVKTEFFDVFIDIVKS